LGSVGVVGGGSRDPQNDPVAVMDLEGEWGARRAVVDRYAEGLLIKRVARIDDSDGLDRLILTVFTTLGIKNIPRSIPWPRSFAII
jgi:hypothetical protein